MIRTPSWTDRLIAIVDQGLRTVATAPPARRPSPAAAVAEPALSPAERRESVRLLRVNRAGEISAQALYLGQALFARDLATWNHLTAAADDELDHLAWCSDRLEALGGRASVFDPCWYLGSAAIGAIAGLTGDATSFGFVAETERQVESHIADHLNRFSPNDSKSRAILEQMALDEARHGREAGRAGALPIREPVRSLMAAGGELLRRLASWL